MSWSNITDYYGVPEREPVLVSFGEGKKSHSNLGTAHQAKPKLRHERGQGKLNFPVQLTTNNIIGNYVDYPMMPSRPKVATSYLCDRGDH